MVSIVIPCYNSELFIAQTIESVLAQTYSNWEMIIVDDCSTDSTIEIIKKYVQQDSRIKYFKTEKTTGSPALPRNMGIEKARGRYIAFLDSDDLWLSSKLEMQMPFFDNNNVAIVYSDYEKMTEDGYRSNRVITSPSILSYRQLLYGNAIPCLTVIYDSARVGDVRFKEIGHEDYAMWLLILRKGFLAVNANENLAIYRVRKNSISSNKLKIIGWIWHIYRKEERINYIFAFFYLIVCLFKSMRKHLV